MSPRFFPFVLLLLLATGCAPAPYAQEARPTPSDGARHFPSDEALVARIQTLVESGRARGIVLGVLEPDGSTRVVSAGSGGPGAQPLGARSVFEVGSIAKTVTATLLADMAARGEVALTAPVAAYLPAGAAVPSRGGREITLLDLATHHSGLPRLAEAEPADPADPYADFGIEQLYAFLARHELWADPGAEFEYSNLGYGLLGHALAHAADRSYGDLARERVFEPLGMGATGYEPDGAWLTSGHDVDGRVVRHWRFTEASRGAGGLYSTAEDLLAYLAANVGPAQSPLERAMRQAHARRRDAGEREIGLAWLVRRVGDRTVVWHGGDTGGYQSFVGFDPEAGVGVVLLSNSDGQDAQLLATAMDLILSPGEAPARVAVPLPAAGVAPYVGTYAYESGGEPRRLRVFEEDAAVRAEMVGGPTFDLFYQGDDTFLLRAGATEVRIAFEVEGGRADALTIHQRGETLPGRRVADAEGEAPPTVRPLAPEAMAPYLGDYRLRLHAAPVDVRVYRDGDDLMADVEGQGTTRLLSLGAHAFLVEVDPDLRFVFEVEGGRAVAFALHSGGRTFPGRRTP